MNYNATCQIIAPKIGVSDTDSLQRTHQGETWPEQRCWAMRSSVTREATALGKVGVGLWDVRLQSVRGIATGYRIKLNLDSEDRWRELEVLTAVKTLHWHLSCRGGT